MQVHVSFHSYFKDLTGCSDATEEMPPGSTLADLLQAVYRRFPRLAALERSTLVAVGVEYQHRDYQLRDQDEVALFPPVQGG